MKINKTLVGIVLLAAGIGVFNQTNERKTVGINFGYKK